MPNHQRSRLSKTNLLDLCAAAQPESATGGGACLETNCKSCLSKKSHVERVVPSKGSPYQFITTTRLPAKGRNNDKTRKLIRRHVMHTFFRRKNLLQSHVAVPSEPAKDGMLGGSTSKFKLERPGSCRRSKEARAKLRETKALEISGSSELGAFCTSPCSREPDGALTPGLYTNIPQNILGAGPMDPFATAALRLNRCMQSLLHRCASQVLSNWQFFLIGVSD
jgi:hypothetical protein